jgi:bidirectional [NiFe] hydrogenase diaphorase subunit
MARTIDLDDVRKVERDARSHYAHRALVCTSTACLAAGAAGVRAALDETVAAAEAEHDAQVVSTGCPGLCSRGPLVRVCSRGEPDTLYQRVDEEGARDIAQRHLLDGQVVDGAPTIDDDLPFFGRQRRVVLATAGRIDPDRLEDYVAEGGYARCPAC